MSVVLTRRGAFGEMISNRDHNQWPLDSVTCYRAEPVSTAVDSDRVRRSKVLFEDDHMNSLLSAQFNTSRVLRQLWLHPGISRAEIADRLGLNRSTLTHIIKGLSDQGIVRTLDGGSAGPLGGRKNVRLSIDPSFGCFGGIDVQPDLLRIVGVNVAGEILFQREVKGRLGGKRLYPGIQGAYEWIQTQARGAGVPLLGVGCGFGGIVDPDDGSVRQSIPLDIVEAEPVGQRLSEFIKEPVLIDNDANCCCWSEIVARRSIEPTSFLFVLGMWCTVRKSPRRDVTGIGMGIAIDDAVHRGKDCSAGEFRSVEWKAGRTNQFSIPDEDISAARSDRKIFLKIVRELARNTSLLVNVLDLEYLYLGGFFREDDLELHKIFKQEIDKNWAYPSQPTCEVKFSTHGELAVAYGAASLFLVRAYGPSEDLMLGGDRVGINVLTS